ncbi:hypothetical protein LCGC14_0387510 [marine sediment metagenome]|uniref:Uncharacterized protein n=1 Tax=marine sediment metagenome TaxID=412755 RepID=A0A0F9T649_9ZZZZ
MIVTTVKEIDGVKFLINIRILEPDDTIGGFPVHYISDRTTYRDTQFMLAVKLMGLKKVARAANIGGGSDAYAQFPIPFIGIKVTQFLLRIYWHIIYLLYSNARFFKEIPQGECFSWRYFTPYVWFKKPKR